MSTRANIILRDCNDEMIFYRHSDGYPDGTLPTLGKFLEWIESIKQFLTAKGNDMKLYVFEIILSANGETPEEAWSDAVDRFVCEPGRCPESEDYKVVEADDGA